MIKGILRIFKLLAHIAIDLLLFDDAVPFDFTLLAVIITLNTLDHKLLRAHGRSGVPSVFYLLPFPEFVLIHGCDDALQNRGDREKSRPVARGRKDRLIKQLQKRRAACLSRTSLNPSRKTQEMLRA